MAQLSDPQGEFAQSYLDGLKEVIDHLEMGRLSALLRKLADAYEQGRTVFVVGNGGSAATASHMAADLGKTILGRSPDPATKRMRVVALTDNLALMTAWANDVGFEVVFSEQLRMLASPGDLLIVITGSGNSPSVLEAVELAREMGVSTFGFLGFDGGSVRDKLDDYILVPSFEYGYVEDLHMVFDHLAVAYLKRVVLKTA